MAKLELKDRNGTWYAVGSIAGQRIRKSLGTSNRKIAEETIAQYEAQLWKRHTYGDSAVRTFEEAALSYMGQGGEKRFLVNILKYFKGRAIGSITPAELREMAIKIYPYAANSTRNRQALIPARAIINHAHDLGWCGAIKVKMFEVPKSNKHKPVSREWLNKFIKQADSDGLPHLAGLVLFMNQTAARVSEAVMLMGDHVNLDQKIAVLSKTKTDEWSVRHLTNELASRIAILQPQVGKPVFYYKDTKGINKTIANVCKRAGIEARTTHSAGRHSFGTNAMNVENPDIKAAMDAGGWKSAKLFLETYVHSHDASRRLAEKFETQNNNGTNLTQVTKIKRQVFDR